MSKPKTRTDAWPNLSNAPIVEGLIDIRVAELAPSFIGLLKTCAESLASEFPSRSEMRRYMGQLTFSPDLGPSLSQADAPAGIRLQSADGKWVAQFRLDGFTLSRLEPYTSWAELSDRARDLWSRYSAAAKPQKIVRLATRFINRIPLPPDEPFDKVFKTTFNISSSLPQAVAGFLLRIVVPFGDEGAMAIITQALEENKQGCVFDLDVFFEVPGGISEEGAWLKFEQLRTVKNRIFFESLTSNVLEKFK